MSLSGLKCPYDLEKSLTCLHGKDHCNISLEIFQVHLDHYLYSISGHALPPSPALPLFSHTHTAEDIIILLAG